MSIVNNITLDQQGIVSYGLSISNSRKYNNDFLVADEETFIVLEPGDIAIYFFPSAGTFFVAPEANDAIPSTPGAAMLTTNSVQNIANVGLEGWTTDRVYIKSAVIQTISAVVFKANNWTTI